MNTVNAYAARSAKESLKPFHIQRREPGLNDVVVDILYCGVCHSDFHQARNEWGSSIFPMVPGHEIVGKVSSVGEHVKKYKIGDHVGIGCFVDSCASLYIKALALNPRYSSFIAKSCDYDVNHYECAKYAW